MLVDCAVLLFPSLTLNLGLLILSSIDWCFMLLAMWVMSKAVYFVAGVGVAQIAFVLFCMTWNFFFLNCLMLILFLLRAVESHRMIFLQVGNVIFPKTFPEKKNTDILQSDRCYPTERMIMQNISQSLFKVLSAKEKCQKWKPHKE